MTFAMEELRDQFHAMETGVQYAFLEFEARLQPSGKFLHIERILPDSEVILRVNQQLKIPVRLSPENP